MLRANFRLTLTSTSDRILAALLLAGFVAYAFAALQLATAPSWQDTEAYLGHALYIAEHGGVWGFLRDSFTGRFPITERHPLYLVMLAPFAERTVDFFWNARLLNLAFGAILLLTLVWMVFRRHGTGPALLAGLIYAVSDSLVTAASHVNHETQFTLCTLWTWWFLTADAESETAGEGDMPRRVARWGIAGAWLGLAYLVKSPASLMGVAIVLAAVWHTGWRFLMGPRIWVLLAATAVLSSPLAVRNLLAFGTPVYEGMNSSIMWFDDWGELGQEHSVMYYDRYGITRIEKNGLPGAADFWREHGLRSIAGRMVKGVVHEITVVARDALGPGYPVPGWLASVWGFAVLGLAVAGWWGRRRSWPGALLFFWSAAFIVFFGWNKLFPDIRYLAPLVPVWISFAAVAGWGLLIRLFDGAGARRLVAMPVVAFALVTCLWVGVSAASGGAKPRMVVTDSYIRLVEWFNGHIEQGDRVLLGPTSDFYGLIWMVERPISVIQMPSLGDLESFQRYLRERHVRYFVMNTENLYGTGRRLEAQMRPYAEVGPDGGLVEKAVLPGWRPVHRDPSSPSRFVIYEAVGTADAPAAER